MSADFLLRPTEESDLPAVTAIYAEAVLTGTASYELEPPSEAEMARRWRELVAKDFPHIVAATEADVLGYAYAGPTGRGPRIDSRSRTASTLRPRRSGEASAGRSSAG